MLFMGIVWQYVVIDNGVSPTGANSLSGPVVILSPDSPNRVYAFEIDGWKILALVRGGNLSLYHNVRVQHKNQSNVDSIRLVPGWFFRISQNIIHRELSYNKSS